MSVSKRTFRVDYSQVPRRPTNMEATTFVWSKLGPAAIHCERIQLKGSSQTAFVQMNSAEAALRAVEEHDRKHSVQCEGNTYVIPFFMDDQTVIVKLYDLSADISDKDIASFLSKYGNVSSIREGVWEEKFPCKGLPDGNRYVTMVVEKPIPSYITIKGETTLLSYQGQIKTCRSCEQQVHHGMTCAKSRKLLKQSANDRLTSYASVLKPSTVAPKTAATTEIIVAPTTKGINARLLTEPLSPSAPAKTQQSIIEKTMRSIEQEIASEQKEAPVTDRSISPAPSPSQAVKKNEDFKAPNQPNSGKRRTGDATDSDASSSSCHSQTKRRAGRPKNSKKNVKQLIDEDLGNDKTMTDGNLSTDIEMS